MWCICTMTCPACSLRAELPQFRCGPYPGSLPCPVVSHGTMTLDVAALHTVGPFNFRVYEGKFNHALCNYRLSGYFSIGDSLCWFLPAIPGLNTSLGAWWCTLLVAVILVIFLIAAHPKRWLSQRKLSE